VEEATALGAGILAAVGSGIYRNVSEAAEAMVVIGNQYSPATETAQVYDRLITIHTEAYQALEKAKVFSRLSTLDA
jgi:xylulokinase